MVSLPAVCQTEPISLPIDSSIAGFSLEAQRKLDKEIKRSEEGRALLHQMVTLDRQAFRPQLLKMIVGAPTVEQIAAYAALEPTKYYQALSIVARLAGYSERPEDGASLSAPFANITGLSDTELVNKLRSIDSSLQTLVGRGPAPSAIVNGEFYDPANPEHDTTTADHEQTSIDDLLYPSD